MIARATGESLMTSGEELYLAMVIAAAIVFAATLGWVSLRH
jgi:hypothetical protein